MSEKKRGISMRRRTNRGPANGSNSPSPIDPDGQPSAPRFSPSRKSVTTGGAVYGALIANERAKLGLTQRELAAKAGTSHSTIARIEQGHPPRPEIRKQLSVALNAAPSSALHFPIVRKAQRGPRKPAKPPRGPRKERPDLGKAPRGPGNTLGDRAKALRARGMVLFERQKALRDGRKAAALDRQKATRSVPRGRPPQTRARRERPGRPHVSPGLRWICGVFALLAILAANVAGSITSSGTTDASSLASAVPVSNVVGAPATIHKARVEAQKRAAAEARRAAAERRREREAAAAAAAAAAASKAAAKEQRQNSAPIAPVTPTVSPSPPPSSGGGGGGSSGRAPDLQHGIGSGGGSAPSGSGSSSTPSDNSPKSASSGGGSTAPSRPSCRLLVLC